MPKPDPKKSRARSRYISVIGLIAVSAAIWFGSETLRGRWLDPLITPLPSTQPSEVNGAPTIENTTTPTSIVLVNVTAEPTITQEILPQTKNSDLLLFAMSDGHFKHLFAYDPQTLPLTRITNNPWDDQYPSVSPDGTKIAYASRRNGYWDIYVFDLVVNKLVRITDTPQYDGAPTWSPDGKWLAYESYLDSNLEILLQSYSNLNQPPIRLTTDSAADYSPAWSPGGRQIAFVSTTAGDEDIWIANLDQAENRFKNLTGDYNGADLFPSWSPDGRYLAWTSSSDGEASIVVQDLTAPASPPRIIGSGQTPTWSSDGQNIAGIIESPGHTSLVAYQVANQQLIIPPVNLPGSVFGMAWKTDPLPSLLVKNFKNDSGSIPPLLWEDTPSESTSSELGRYNLTMLEDINATYPFLQDNTAESFTALRDEIARQSGWDLLADLENAFIPITEPPNPGGVDDWLYTGRAFALQKTPIQAGWMVIAREKFGSDIYWRLWIKTRYQDGSQGEPIRVNIWNLDARYSGNSRAHEDGGELLPPPSGYWLDITELAGRFGWKPLPALSNWRNYYPAARFNQFVFNEGLDWDSAMEQIYPPEAVREPTGVPTQPISSMLTPAAQATATVPPNPTSPGDPTIRPTWTPMPGIEQP